MMSPSNLKRRGWRERDTASARLSLKLFSDLFRIPSCGTETVGDNNVFDLQPTAQFLQVIWEIRCKNASIVLKVPIIW